MASDSTNTSPVRVSPVIPLSALFSGTFGVGLGAGVRVENVGRAGSDVTATAFGAFHGYGADLTLRTGDPYGAPLYGLLHAEVSRATRRRFFGIGPSTKESDRVDLRHTSATIEARVGAYPLQTTALIVQPSARFLVDHLDRFDLETAAAIGQLDATSQASAGALLDGTRVGVSLGLELATDRLDAHDVPTTGTYASVEARRFVALDGSGLRFTRFASSISGYLPLRDRLAISGHAVGTVTRQDEDAVLPFVYLPTLDNDLLLAYSTDRFRGRDALALGVGLRVPVLSLYGIYGLDAEITGTVGSVYTNLFDQFEPSISFDSSPSPETPAALRPAASLGLTLVNLNASSMVIGGRVGISPEGPHAAFVAIKADLRDVVPLFR